MTVRHRCPRRGRAVRLTVPVTVLLALLLALPLAGCGGGGSATRTPRAAPTTSSTGFVSPLVPGPYGFLVLRGWRIEPLRASTSTVRIARFTNPNGPGEIDYLVGTDDAGVIHDRSGRPNVVGALGLVGCAVTGSTMLGVDRARFTCRPTAAGLAVVGAVVVEPAPSGPTPWTWRALRVALPPAKHDTALAVVVSFRP